MKKYFISVGLAITLFFSGCTYNYYIIDPVHKVPTQKTTVQKIGKHVISKKTSTINKPCDCEKRIVRTNFTRN